MEAFKGAVPTASDKHYGWVDGVIEPIDDISLPLNALGVQYGYGFFETIYAQNGFCPLLDQHLKRFAKTWVDLMPDAAPDLTWADIIGEVLARNGLDNQTAAVKIALWRGTRQAAPWDHHLVVTARPYEHRLSALNIDGLRLAIYPEPRQTPLADYKTLNYLFYHKAGEWAKAKGAHEALILNPGGTISETNTANLLLIKGTDVLRPQSAHVLPGVMQAEACRRLADLGYKIKTAAITPQAFNDDTQVILTNALMGAVPVIAIDRKPLPPNQKLCQRINQAVFGTKTR